MDSDLQGGIFFFKRDNEKREMAKEWNRKKIYSHQSRAVD